MSDDQAPKVGYKNPPKHTQFKKGYSGNLRGRPRKLPDLRSPHETQYRHDFIAMAEQEIKVTIGGKATKLPAIFAVYQAQFAKALAGDVRSAKLVMDNYRLCMTLNGGGVAKLYATFAQQKRIFEHQIATAQNLSDVHAREKEYKEYLESEPVKALYERMEEPMPKFKV